MDEARLAGLLAELTGSLSALEGAPSDALDRVRRLLANALLTPQLEPVMDPAGPNFPTGLDELPQATLEALQRVVHDVTPAPRDATLRVFRRTWPLLSTHVQQSVPAWARGWLPRESLGPFESAEGRLVWFDIRHTDDALSVTDSHSGRLLFALPRATLAGPVNIGVTSIEIPAGSVWLAVSLFDANAPAGSLAGLRVVRGSLSLSHPGIVHGKVIGLGPGVVATLHLQLDPGEPPPRARHGGDSRSLKIDPVHEALFVFNVGVGAQLVRASTGSLEIYGNRVRLHYREGARARYDSSLGWLWFPMPTDRDALKVDESRSQIFRVAGEAAIKEGGWALPVAIPITQSQGAALLVLGEAAGAGALALSLGRGLAAGLQPAQSTKPLPLDSTLLHAEPGHISVLATSAAARYRRVFDLWEDNAERPSQIELRSADPLLLRLDATTAGGGAEALGISTLECTIRLDRPLAASGKRVPFFSARAALDVLQVVDDTRLYVGAFADPARDPVSNQPLPPQPLSIALSNALLCTTPPLALQIGGVLGAPSQLDRGVLTLQFAIRFLMPSLPDPYAANIARQAPRQLMDPASIARGQPLTGRVRWAEPASAQLTFALIVGGDLGLAQGLVRLEDTPIQSDVRRERDYLPEVESHFPRATGHGPEFLRMLDVSSNADLFGVGLSSAMEFRGARQPPLQLRGLDLIAPVRNVSAFTLPAFQWEPVYNIPAEGALPFPPRLVSSTDGGATRFATPAATLVPVAPLPVVDTLLSEYNRRHNTVAARFTLPFGMVAVTEMHRVADPLNLGFRSPRFASVRPDFASTGLSGGLQLSLEAPPNLLAAIAGPSPGLPGATVQTDNGTGGFNVLKSGFVDEIFNTTFADQMKMVPVQRIDFSGYGASVFSDWRHRM